MESAEPCRMRREAARAVGAGMVRILFLLRVGRALMNVLRAHSGSAPPEESDGGSDFSDGELAADLDNELPTSPTM